MARPRPLRSHVSIRRRDRARPGLALVAALLAALLGWTVPAGGGPPARGGSPPASQAAAADLTRRLVVLHARYRVATAAEEPRLLADLLALAAARHQALAALVETDPGEVLRVAVPAGLRATFPAAVQVHLEAEAEVEGTLEVYHEDRAHGSRELYFLDTRDGRLSLHFAAEPPDLPTGSRVRVRGVQVERALALDSGAASVEALASVAPNTFGEQRVIAILVNFRDKTTQPYTHGQVAALLFGTVNDFYRENSYGQTWLTGDVVGWYTLPLDSTVCSTSSLATYAQQAAAAAGVDLSAYRRQMYVFPRNACTFSGAATVGGNPSKAWINGSLTLRTVAHELGHNFGDYHSRSQSCDPVGCTTAEYGDGWDVMGAAASGHLNAFQKERLGWLGHGSSPPLVLAESDGTYRLDPYEPGGTSPKALKVLKSTDPATGRRTWYYVEFRARLGFDANLATAVLLHTGTESQANSSYLWDLAPAVSSTDWILDVGQAYGDPSAGVTLTTVALDAGGASVRVAYGPLPCVPAEPLVTLAPSVTQWVEPGTPVSYEVSVTNRDTTGCAASTFVLDAEEPAGWTALADPAAMTVGPGTTAWATLTLASPAGAPSGFYTVPVTATDAADPGHAGTASATQMVVAALEVRAWPGAPSYSPGAWATVSAAVTVEGAPVSGASVAFTVTKPDGSAYAATQTTDAAGVAAYRFRVKPRDPVGTWWVRAVATRGGTRGEGTASFSVAK